MSTPLRVGFLISGVLHVAVVAAFSLSVQQDVRVADETLPITLQLAAFQPSPPAPVAPSTPQPLPPEPVAEPPPNPVIAQPEPSPPIEPQPAVLPERRAVKPSRPETPAVPRRVVPPKLAAVKPGRAEPPPAATPAVPPTTVARAETPRPAVAVVDVQATQHYLAALAAQINRSKYYPRASRRLGEEGMVVVSFVIQRSGELTDLSIVESSGHRRLDEAALKTLQRVSPFEKIPEVIDRDQWPISVPIAFSLRG